MNHSIQKDAIFSHSWGYEQTNIDYYKVVKATPKCVYVRKLQSIKNYTNAMCGESMPDICNFYNNEKPIRKTVKTTGTEVYLSFEYGWCSEWTGEPEEFSCWH